MWEKSEYLSYYLENIEEKGKQFRSNFNSITFKYILWNRPFLTILKKPLKFAAILDIGGGGGDNYFYFRNSIKNNNIIYYILDSKKLFSSAEDTRKKYSKPNDKFLHLEHLEEISNVRIDIVLLIGTLQYLSEKELSVLLSNLRHVNDIIVARTPITTHKRETMQIARIPVGQKIKLEKVQIYLRSRRALKKEFNYFGFKLRNSGLPLPYSLSTEQGEVLSYYQMVHFYRDS
jgi:putative methyltransferase (TIGR04325 family)